MVMFVRHIYLRLPIHIFMDVYKLQSTPTILRDVKNDTVDSPGSSLLWSLEPKIQFRDIPFKTSFPTKILTLISIRSTRIS